MQQKKKTLSTELIQGLHTGWVLWFPGKILPGKILAATRKNLVMHVNILNNRKNPVIHLMF